MSVWLQERRGVRTTNVNVGKKTNSTTNSMRNRSLALWKVLLWETTSRESSHGRRVNSSNSILPCSVREDGEDILLTRSCGDQDKKMVHCDDVGDKRKRVTGNIKYSTYMGCDCSKLRSWCRKLLDATHQEFPRCYTCATTATANDKAKISCAS
jgi:hypothetical protein